MLPIDYINGFDPTNRVCQIMAEYFFPLRYDESYPCKLPHSPEGSDQFQELRSFMFRVTPEQMDLLKQKVNEILAVDDQFYEFLCSQVRNYGLYKESYLSVSNLLLKHNLDVFDGMVFKNGKRIMPKEYLKIIKRHKGPFPYKELKILTLLRQRKIA